MRHVSKLAVVIGAVAALGTSLVGCGPSARNNNGDGDGGTGGPDAYTGPVATVSGKVWAPRWAPGEVPAGQEIPIFGALVYVSATKPAPIPQATYCEQCVDAPAGGVLTGHDGSFSLSVPPGDYWLVIQKGQFRYERQVSLAVGSTALTPAETTLPSKNDPANGAWIPKIAIATGNYDAVEDIMAKIGIGTLGANNKLSDPKGDSATAELTMYTWGGSGAGSVNFLLTHPEELHKYNIIFFPCSTSVDDTLLADQNTLKNIRQFVHDGGKLYVTDWSGETSDRAFPHQVVLGGFGNDSEGTYDPVALTGTLTTTGSSDGDLYSANDGKAVDPDLSAWLGLQMGPNEDNASIGIYDPTHFTVVDNWNTIDKLNPVMIGTDMAGMPVYDTPKPWITGSDGVGHNGPLSVTYQPTGCGKVLYSTFQTSGANASESHAGLMPQERVLLFLIMEIAACTNNPVIG
jgi:hypothetical protein